MASAPLTFVVVAGADGEGRIHQDAGDGYGYRRNAWRTTTVTQIGGRIVRLKHSGDFKEARAVSFIQVLGLNDRPKEIRIDGRETKNVHFQSDDRRLRLMLPGGASEITFVP
jgi:hypothetical protein